MAGERFIHRVVINEYLDVAWDKTDERVQVLIAGEPFIHCKFLIARLSPTDTDVASIDDLARKRKAKKFEYGGIRGYITVEEEVFAHASNIQAWADNDYDTRLLHSNISFPLLKALAEAGDAKAKRLLGSEVADRIHEGNASTVDFILETLPELVELETLMELTRDAPKERLFTIWMIIGNKLLKTQPAEAHKAFQHALLINEYRSDTWQGLCRYYTSQGKPAEAIFTGEQALERSRWDAEHWVTLGDALCKFGFTEEGRASFHVALRKNPSDAIKNLASSRLKVMGDLGSGTDPVRFKGFNWHLRTNDFRENYTPFVCIGIVVTLIILAFTVWTYSWIIAVIVAVALIADFVRDRDYYYLPRHLVGRGEYDKNDHKSPVRALQDLITKRFSEIVDETVSSSFFRFE